MPTERPVLGLSIAVFGCCAAAAGYTLQKYSHVQTARANQNLAPQSRQPYWKRCEFIVGCMFLAVSSVAAMTSFSFVGQAELAPMGAVTLAVQEVLASLVLREPFTRIDGAAVGLMSIGTTLALVTAQSAKQEFTLELITALFLRPVAVLSCVVAFVVITALASFVAAVGNAPTSALSPATASLDAMSRSVIAGVLGGFTSTLGKASSVLLFSPLARAQWSVLFLFEPWISLSALLCVITVQLRYLNSGLGRYDSLRIAPYYQSSMIMSNLFAGLVIWDEIAVQTATSLALFALGCAVTIAGQLVLLLKVHSPSEELVDSTATAPGEQDDTEGEDDGVAASTCSTTDTSVVVDPAPTLDAAATVSTASAVLSVTDGVLGGDSQLEDAARESWRRDLPGGARVPVGLGSVLQWGAGRRSRG